MSKYAYQINFLPLFFSHWQWVRRFYKGYWVRLPRDRSWVAYHQDELDQSSNKYLRENGFIIEYYGDRK